MRWISLTAAAAHLPDLVESATREEGVMLTAEGGDPVAVLVSFQEFQALQVARSLARDPERLVEIVDARNAAQAGNFERFERLRDVLEDIGR